MFGNRIEESRGITIRVGTRVDVDGWCGPLWASFVALPTARAFRRCNDADGWRGGTPTRVPTLPHHRPRPYGLARSTPLFSDIAHRLTEIIRTGMAFAMFLEDTDLERTV